MGGLARRASSRMPAGRSLESPHREREVLVVRVPVRPPQRVVGIAEPDPEAAHQGLFALDCCRAHGAPDDRRDVRGDLAPLSGGEGSPVGTPVGQVVNRRLERALVEVPGPAGLALHWTPEDAFGSTPLIAGRPSSAGGSVVWPWTAPAPCARQSPSGLPSNGRWHWPPDPQSRRRAHRRKFTPIPRAEISAMGRDTISASWCADPQEAHTRSRAEPGGPN